MKRLSLMLVMAAFLVSCTRRTAVAAKDGADGLHIAATFYPLYIMCLNITDNVEDVSLSCLAPATVGCLHDYSLTTREAAALESADIIVANGAGMEPFLERLLQARDNVIVASDGYPLIDGNPHIFVSVEGARYEASTIAKGLAAMDAAHAAAYMEGAKRYDDELSSLQAEMHSALDTYSGRSIVTFHEAFPYFARDFGLDVLAVIEREPGTVPSAKEIAETVRTIKADIAKGKPPALFAEPQYSPAAASLIETETGLKVYNLDPCVTGKMAAGAYIQAQRQNARVLAAAMQENNSGNNGKDVL